MFLQQSRILGCLLQKHCSTQIVSSFACSVSNVNCQALPAEHSMLNIQYVIYFWCRSSTVDSRTYDMLHIAPKFGLNPMDFPSWNVIECDANKLLVKKTINVIQNSKLAWFNCFPQEWVFFGWVIYLTILYITSVLSV